MGHHHTYAYIDTMHLSDTQVCNFRFSWKTVDSAKNHNDPIHLSTVPQDLPVDLVHV